MKRGSVGEEASLEAVAVLQARVGSLDGRWMGPARLQSAWKVEAMGRGPRRG